MSLWMSSIVYRVYVVAKHYVSWVIHLCKMWIVISVLSFWSLGTFNIMSRIPEVQSWIVWLSRLRWSHFMTFLVRVSFTVLFSADAMRQWILLPEVTWIFSWLCICCRFPAVSMHGDKSQQERDHVLRGMQSCYIHICWYWAKYYEVHMFFLGATETCTWSRYSIGFINWGVLKWNHKLNFGATAVP